MVGVGGLWGDAVSRHGPPIGSGVTNAGVGGDEFLSYPRMRVSMVFEGGRHGPPIEAGVTNAGGGVTNAGVGSRLPSIGIKFRHDHLICLR